ncbi:hypothetical protein ABPG72_001338 [Tetrahymena utriculariae]
MGCSNSRQGETHNPNANTQKPKLQKKPEFQNECKSLLSKYLTDDVFQQLNGIQDKFGYSLAELINSGVVNQNSSIGVYAGSPDSYITFAPLLNQIIQEYHGYDPADLHKSDWDASKCNFQPLEDQYCMSTRIRFARNLADFPLGTKITKEQRRQVENIAKEAFQKFEGELVGTYHSLVNMDKQTQKQLIEEHYLFKEGDKYLEAAGLNRDWPDGRGIFINNLKTFLIWVNEEDQFRVISMQKGGDIKAVFSRLSNAHTIINKVAKFAYNDHLGAIATCPTNIGTGLRASIHVKLPLLSKDMDTLQKIAEKNHVQIRGIHGEHSESEGGIFDVSNKRRIGFSEVELVHDMYNGVKEMIEKEKELEKHAIQS